MVGRPDGTDGKNSKRDLREMVTHTLAEFGLTGANRLTGALTETLWAGLVRVIPRWAWVSRHDRARQGR
ncbi:MAG TPA: hypothetical protein VE197_11105 [Mycobacterium sp.]|nr:hypothetical protein [Mycobacterium sp.]